MSSTNYPAAIGNYLAKASAFVDRARVFFIPLAMAALLAVGAHAAADALGDIFLDWIDRAQGAFDWLVSRWSVTAPLVDFIGLARRTQMARLFALSFELAADVLLAFRMLGFEEAPGLLVRAKSVCIQIARRPTSLSIVRPLFTAALGLAGCASVARLFHGAIALQLRPLFGRSGLGVPRVLGLVALVWLILAIASRSVLRALEHSEAKAQRALDFRQRYLLGLTGSLLLAPLALTALLRALPLDSFLR